MRTFIQQQQPTQNSCVSTSLAMLLGRPAKEVIEEFHDLYFANKAEVHDYLQVSGFEEDKDFFCLGVKDQYAEWGNVYLGAAPSLNLERYLHYILLDYRRTGELVVYDPQNGNEGKRFYTADDLECVVLEYRIPETSKILGAAE